jgi:hypothetical protein
MLNPQNIYRDGLARVLKEIGRKNVRYHAFRRFRESVLLRSECRNILINFWIGHADSEMSSRYGKQLLEDVEFRQEWAKKVGLGFDLPASPTFHEGPESILLISKGITQRSLSNY